MPSLIQRSAISVLGVVIIASLLAACGGEGGVEVTGSASVSGEPAGPGVVTAKPAGATQIDVTLKEWAVALSQSTVRAGEVYFLVDNQGPEDPHEFVIIRSDASPLSLPFENNRVPEDKVKIVDEIEPFTPNSKASIAVNLSVGSYLLICNISEVEDGQIESHYKLGMVAQLKVQ